MSNQKHHDATGYADDLPAVMMLSSIDLFADAGTKESPDITMANASGYGASTSGLGLYIFKTVADFSDFIDGLRTKPWVLQGVQSVTLIPQPTRYHPGFTYGVFNGIDIFHRSVSGLYGDWGGSFGEVPEMRSEAVYLNWRNDSFINDQIPARYRHLDKLKTFPYMVIEATTWSGNALVIKPESWNDPDATIMERANIMPPTQRVTYTIRGYNARDVAEDDWNGDDGGDFLDMSINIDSFPTIPIMNDAGIMYLAQNAHGLAFEMQSADWSQQRAMASSRTAYSQASAGIQATREQTALSNRNSRNVTDWNNAMNMRSAIVGGIGGIGQGAASGTIAGPAGTLAGAAGGAVSMPMQIIGAGMAAEQASGLNAMQMSTASEAMGIATGQAGYLRDSNRDLATFAAEGDYQNTIASINAKTQDAQLTQPSLKGQFGGDLININHGTSELSLRWKMIDNASMAVIGEFWLRYGYAVQRFGTIPASLMVMSKFTYWKLSETYITSAPMPEQFKQAIRGIFEKGVTVWKTPSDIGNIDTADNAILAGVTL